MATLTSFPLSLKSEAARLPALWFWFCNHSLFPCWALLQRTSTVCVLLLSPIHSSHAGLCCVGCCIVRGYRWKGMWRGTTISMVRSAAVTGEHISPPPSPPPSHAAAATSKLPSKGILRRPIQGRGGPQTSCTGTGGGGSDRIWKYKGSLSSKLSSAATGEAKLSPIPPSPLPSPPLHSHLLAPGPHLTTYSLVKQRCIEKQWLADSTPLHILGSLCGGLSGVACNHPFDLVRNKL
jgi:hypothetical protein